MWPGWVSNPGPLTYESGALPTALLAPQRSLQILCIDNEGGSVFRVNKKNIPETLISLTQPNKYCPRW